MALSFRVGYDAIHDGNAADIQRIIMAGVKVALQVGAEAGATPNYVNRNLLATKVLLDPDGWGLRFAYAVVVDQSAGANMNDAELQGIILNNWNSYAGSVAA